MTIFVGLIVLAAAGLSAWLASRPMTATATRGMPPGSDRLGLDLADIQYVTGQAATETGPKEPGLLYDSRRGVYYSKPALRGWLHLVCFWVSVAGGSLLLTRAHGEAETAATVIYSASLSALFGTSALYHRGTWTAAMRLQLRHLDQAMIFFLIAGTATPVCLLSAPASTGLICLIVMGVLMATAVAIRPDAVERARAGRRSAVHRARLRGRPRAAVGVDPCRQRIRCADHARRPALHRRSAFLSLALARSVPVGVRLPRGLSLLHLRRRGLPYAAIARLIS